MFRVGVLGRVAPNLYEAFREGLRDSGYIEAQNLILAHQVAEGSVSQFAASAANLVRTKVAVIFAVGPAALKAAAKETKRLPIVAIDLETDPIESGFAASLSRPGGNITGLFLDAPELTGKWLELLKEVVPRLSRVAALWDPATGRYQLTAASAAARSLAVQLQPAEVRGPDEFDPALAAAIRGRPGALIELSSPLFYSNSKRIAEFTLRNRLPAISLFRVFPESGGLMAYGPDLVDLFRRCGVYAGKILTAAKPGDLPIERPTRFQLVINLRTAKALGLTIPQALLMRADEVIK